MKIQFEAYEKGWEYQKHLRELCARFPLITMGVRCHVQMGPFENPTLVISIGFRFDSAGLFQDAFWRFQPETGWTVCLDFYPLA